MKKDGNSGEKRSTDDINKKNNHVRNKETSDEELRQPSVSKQADPVYELGVMGAEADDERQGSIIPDDPIEAEQVESEKLRFGFSFEPKEGQLGDETEDEGDLTADQRRTGNRYRPSMGVDDGERDEENIASDQELRVTDQGHIGMAFGEDNYVEKEEDEEEEI